jgi:hypothetical protein
MPWMIHLLRAVHDVHAHMGCQYCGFGFKLSPKSKTRDLSDRGFSVFSATPLDMDFCAWMMQ